MLRLGHVVVAEGKCGVYGAPRVSKSRNARRRNRNLQKKKKLRKIKQEMQVKGSATKNSSRMQKSMVLITKQIPLGMQNKNFMRR